MVRETRHLWIGNLPENVREEQIRDLFQRHGRVQSVKLVSSEDNSTTPNNTLNNNSSSAGGVIRGKNAATVSFIDIRSAAKALRGAYSLGGQPLHIKYYEPNSVPPRGDITNSEHENSSSAPGGGGIGGSMGDNTTNTTALTAGSDQVNSQSTTSAATNNTTSGIGHGATSNINNMNSSCSTSNGPMSASTGNNSIGPPYRHQRFPVQHGQSEDSSHFYEQPKNFSRGRGDGHFHHRGRRGDQRNSYHNRHQFQDRNYNRMSNNWNNYQNENRFAPPEGEDRSSGPPPVSHNSSSEPGNNVPRRPESPGGSVSSRHMSRHRSRSVSESGSSDRGSSAGSRSRSGSRSSVSTSASSAHSRSPARRTSTMGHFSRGGSIASNSSGRFHRNSYSRHRYSRSRLVSRPADSSRVHHGSSRSSPVGANSRSSSSSSSSSPHRKVVTAPHSPSRSPSSTKSYSPSRSVNNTGHHHHSSSHRRPPNNAELACAIRIRNLPSRSSDSSLKDGLFHEYKKHGKVSWVRINGGGAGRYAIVCFKSADQAARAVTHSQDKQFFGCKIQVSPYFDGSERVNGGGEEVIPVDEQNQVNGDELPSVPYPTRSVLVNGLDTSVTAQEMRQAFEQYGDIVDLQRVSGNTHAICEFVDIASAIRAQWGRYVFKSREARVSFAGSPATCSLLLDGTANVTEKQVDSYCRQYGAIKNVIMDHARILALVQFESISSAQTASRELRSWVINRKHLHVDFASSVCTKMFTERLKSLPKIPIDIDGNGSISSPRRIGSLSPTSISSKESNSRSKRTSRRIMDDSSVERKSHRRRDQEFDESTHKYPDDLASSENVSRTVEFGQNLENQAEGRNNRSHNSTRHSRNDARLSPVSPTNNDGEAEKKSEKLSKSSSSKIDLSCHETDSAIVTSSSDVICPEKDTPDIPLSHESSGSSNSHSTLEDPEVLLNDSGAGLVKRKPITWSKPKNVMITVDGVSSTSPEPKNEAVRKVSPDSGTGSRIPVAESIARIAPLVYHMSNGPTDPRKKASDDQRRRASADSAHQEILSTTSTRVVRNLGSVENAVHETSAESPTTDDLDDRPGTPLCDENPESFTTEEPSVTQDRIKVQPSRSTSRSVSKSEEPLSLPLPEFALQKQSKSGFKKNSSENLDKIPIIPLTSTIESISENSPVRTSIEKVEIPSTSAMCGAVILESKDTAAVEETSSVKSQDAGDAETSIEGSRISDDSVLLVDEMNSPSPVSIIHLDDKDDDVNSLSSSDSEGKSTRNSPTAEQLEQRIQKLYEKYDQWNGSRTAIKATTVPNSSLNFSLSSDSAFLAGNKSSESAQDGDQSASSMLNKPWFARTKPLSLDEMKHEPSDIVKSLLAKKSVFDEDSKRLENFEEKYEPKSISAINSTNWRQALNRSASTPSTASLLSPTLSISSPSKAPVFSPSLSSHSSTRSLSQTTTVSPSSLSAFGIGKAFGSHSSTSSLMKRRDSLQSDGSKESLNKLNLNLRPMSTHSPSSDASSSGKSPNMTTGPSRPHQQTSTDSPKTPTVRPGYCIKPKYPSINSAESPSGLTPVKSGPAAKQQEKESNILKNLNIPQPHVPHSSKPTTSVQTPSSAPPQVGIHQGIPRMVERSTSLDSKKNLSAVNAATAHNSIPSTAHISNPTPTANSKSSVVTPATNRRPSAEINPPQALPHAGGSHLKENSKPSALGDNKGGKPESKETVHVKEVIPKEPKPTPSLTILPQKEVAKPFRFDNLMKIDHVSMNHEQTVAVVSTIQQTPVLQAQKSSGHNSGNPDKEKSNGVNGNSGKRDKDKDAYVNKKNHASGSGNPVNNNIKPVQSNSNPKLEKEKKEKDKNKSSKVVDVNNHHSENKKKEKEKVAEASHSQKKDKEKVRRAHSSLEKDEKDAKKVKLDKDASTDSKEAKEINSHSHAHKNSNDRRESVDVTVTSKTKPSKDKHANVNGPEQSSVSKVATVEKNESSIPQQAKPEKSEKDHHHKSKSSNGGSSSKHHHSSADKLNATPHNSHKHKEKKEVKEATVTSVSNKEKEKSSSASKSSEKLSTSSSKSSSTAVDGHKHVNHHKKEKESSTSSTKDKVKSKDREKDKSKVSTSSSFMTSIDSDAAIEHDESPQAKSYSQIKDKKDKSKSEKSGNTERQRRKSGGESSSAAGPSDSTKVNSKEKMKQQKKRRRIVVDDSDSSSDDEQKHHSIFEVVIDEYVSMYDKVKARSNRACKQVPQQQKDEDRKQDKLEESFQKLKKSRAKREEKKRSSTEDRKSLNTSSDDESHHSDATHSDQDHKPKFEKVKTKPFKGLNTSDDEDEEHRTSKPSKTDSRSKSKSMSSGKSSKRPKKREISPMRPSSYLLSNSDQSDVEPVSKKSKLGSKHQIEMITSEAKSTESDTDEDEKPRKLLKSSSSLLKNKQMKKNLSHETYAESDNSVKSGLGKKSSEKQIVKSKKEKTSKQKSIDAMKKSLFDISNSSDESSKVASFSPKKEKLSSKHSSKSRTKSDKENKSHRKSASPSHSHRPSTSSNTSSKKDKTKRRSQDSGKLHLIRRESSVLTTEADLFGSMSSSNESDTEIKRKLPKPIMKEERPPTPPIVSSSVEEMHLSHKSKHSNNERSKQKKHSSSSQRTSHDNKEGDSHQSSKPSSEKKKRKHHKRSRHDEDHKKSPEKSTVKQEPLVDYTSLFNSPPTAQPIIPGLRDEHLGTDTFKSEKLFSGLAPPSSSSARSSPARLKEADVIDESMKSMFSSDEDEEEDTNLKMGITEAIMASEDEKPGDENLTPAEIALRKELQEKEAAAAAKRLEEEIKRNCLFEQDKAIESILMERKSPAASLDATGAHGQPAEGEEGAAKDHEPAISQEETEDAVAALLGTLGREDDEAEDGALEKSHGPRSPPTLRIIEEASPSVPAIPEHERSVSPANTNSPWYAKSPELQIDEDAGSKQNEPEQRSPVPPHVHIPKTPEEKFDLLKKFTQEYGEALDTSAPGEESDKASVSSSHSRRNSRQSSDGRMRNDIYEFHDDDDDEKTRRAKACAVPAPITQQRISADSLPAKSPVAAIEPVIVLPAVSPDSVVPKPPEIPLHVTIPSPDIKPSVIETVPSSASSLSPVGKKPSQSTPPHISQPPSIPLSGRTSVDDTIDHVIRMANIEAAMNPFIPTKPAARGRSRSKSKDTNDDQSAAIAAIISRVSRSGESPKRTSPDTPGPPPGEPQINIVQLPKPVIPGLDTRIEPPRTPTIKDTREDTPPDIKPNVLQSVVKQPEERPPFPPTPEKPDSDRQFLQQQLHAYKMQPPHVQQQFEKIPPHLPPQQFAEGLGGTMAKQQFQQQQQHRVEVSQHRAPTPTSKSQMPSPPVQPKTAIIYTTSEPFVPNKFTPMSGPVSEAGHIVNPTSLHMSRPGFYPTPNLYQMSVMKSHEMFSQGPKGFPEMRPPHPNIPNLSVPSSQSQVQAQLVRIPQVPPATTITKVDKAEDQPNRTISVMQQQHPCVIFTSAGQGPVIRTSIPPNHPPSRPNDKFIIQGAPRVEISGGHLPPSAGSPKAGRIPFQYESNQPQSGQHRIIPPQLLPYDAQMESTSPTAQPLDLAPSNQNKESSYSSNVNAKHSSTNNSSSPLSPYIQQSRQVDGRILQLQRPPQDSPQQFVQSPHGYPHYVPVSIAANMQSLGGGQPSPTIYGSRPGSSHSSDGKGQTDVIKGMPDRRPSPAHIMPPHIASPASDRGSAESPRLTPSYGRQFFTGTPSQLSISHSPQSAHPHPRHMLAHPYADMEEQGYAHPAPGAFYQSAIVRERELGRERERERESNSREREEAVEYEQRRRYSSPPPAHIRFAGLQMANADGPPTELQRHIPSSPLGSQVSAQGDSLLMLLQRYPIMWQGSLVLKNDNAACQMHFVSGNLHVARDSFPSNVDGSNATLKISQRMRLEQTQLDGVARKLQLDQEHCMLLALPCGRDHMDVLQQSNNLRNGFITYLQLKQAAGIVNIQHPDSQMPAYVIHIFPSCDFANENLARIAPDLLNGVADIAHLLIVIATV